MALAFVCSGLCLLFCYALCNVSCLPACLSTYRSSALPLLCATIARVCRERVGKYFIQLCGTTPCMVNGSEEIKATIEKHLGIHDGGELRQRSTAMRPLVGDPRRFVALSSPWLIGGYSGDGTDPPDRIACLCASQHSLHSLPYPFFFFSLSFYLFTVPQRLRLTVCLRSRRWSAWAHAPTRPWCRCVPSYRYLLTLAAVAAYLLPFV